MNCRTISKYDDATQKIKYICIDQVNAFDSREVYNVHNFRRTFAIYVPDYVIRRTIY